jgi:putative ABC transport system ATP-binding protein
MSDVLLEVRGVHRRFDDGRVQALRGIDLTVRTGEFVAIAGPSGCGKSTLLQLLGALDNPDEGEVLFRSRALSKLPDPGRFRATTVGFVFQAFHLIPTLTALENVQMPMFEMPWRGAERRSRAGQLLETVGLGQRLGHLPQKLSGGERQRVAIARSLANEPELLLADEPTGNLDSESAGRVMELLVDLHRSRGMTLVIVTHDPVVARCAGRIVRMLDGHITSDGPV